MQIEAQEEVIQNLEEKKTVKFVLIEDGRGQVLELFGYEDNHTDHAPANKDSFIGAGVARLESSPDINSLHVAWASYTFENHPDYLRSRPTDENEAKKILGETRNAIFEWLKTKMV